MKLQLPHNIFSSQDLDRLLLEVKEYRKWLAHSSVKERAGAKLTEEPELSPEAMQLINDCRGNKDLATKKLDELLFSLEECRDTAPRMTITLAAPPTGDIKETLVTWCRENIAPYTLVRFAFNSNILGGLVVRLGSHIYDWSFRRRILENRKQFPEILRNV